MDPEKDVEGSQELLEDTAQEPPQDANVEALMENLRVMAEEREQARQEMLRAIADLQNFRRRTQQEKEQLRQVATEGLVVKLLPILDNFERSISALESGASPESILEGIRGIERQLRSALESVQLTRIPAVGEPFDPHRHDAVVAEPHEELPENTVLEELEAGYAMAGHVIRPARVKVSKKP